LRRKSRVSTAIIWALLLVVFGIAMFVGGYVFRLNWGQVIGGIVFGTGLGVLSATFSSGVTVRVELCHLRLSQALDQSLKLGLLTRNVADLVTPHAARQAGH
jgi:hypothetical protein